MWQGLSQGGLREDCIVGVIGGSGTTAAQGAAGTLIYSFIHIQGYILWMCRGGLTAARALMHPYCCALSHAGFETNNTIKLTITPQNASALLFVRNFGTGVQCKDKGKGNSDTVCYGSGRAGGSGR